MLLTGPAIRAVAAGSGRVTMLCGPRGRAAAELLAGIDALACWHAPWIDPEPDPVDRASVDGLVDDLRARAVDEAVIFTSFHQSPLPLALLLRLAGVGRVSAISVDYPGSLIDVRHRVSDDVHEVERALSLAQAAGFALPAGDDGRLRVRGAGDGAQAGAGPFVAVHPGASVPARAWSPDRHRELVGALVHAGRRVVVTGGTDELELTAHVADGAPRDVLDLGGALSIGELAGVLARADAVVVGNTGPAHLAAAVGTPVVSLFAPTVPVVRWRPWAVPAETLYVDVPCAGCRARRCPVPGHPCVDDVGVGEVLAALDRLAPRPARRGRQEVVAA